MSDGRTIEVDVPQGRLRAAVDRGVVRALGIPYAAPIDAASRFRPASPAAPWTGVRDALEPGPIALQHGVDPSTAMAESCHRLHVWAPEDRGDAPRPVVVWLHGGGWYVGQPILPKSDGANLARSAGVVVVSVTHRLGLLGCLYLADHLGDDHLDSGTAVLDDLLLALRWIREGIAAFGGDPGNVTIIGCSGGGAKVSALVSSEAARGLFRRGIVQSGSAEHYLSPEEGVELTDRVLRILDLPRDRAAGLLELPPAALAAAQTELFKRSPWTPILGTATGLLPFPTINGRTLAALPGDAMRTATEHCPLIIGSAWEEATLPISRMQLDERLTLEDVDHRIRPNLGGATSEVMSTYRALLPDASPRELMMRLGSDVESFRAHRLAMSRPATAETRLYRLDWGSTAYDGTPRACHCLEVGLVFRNTHEPKLLEQPDAASMSDVISAPVVDFAHGRPALVLGGASALEWPRFTPDRPAGAVVAAEPRIDPDIHAAAVEIWSAYTHLVRR